MRPHRVVALLMLAATATTSSAQDPVARRPTAPPVPVTDSAQPAVPQEARPASPSCWRARRACKTHFLTDIGFEYAVASTKHADPAMPGGKSRDFGGRVIWTIGFMSGSGRQSHGAAASIVSDEMVGGIPFIV